MSRIVDKPYFTYSAYNALTSGIQVKCPKCHGTGVVTADDDNAYFRCLSCGHQKTRDRTIYRYDVHNQCKNCGRYYRVDIEDEARQHFSVLHVACPYCGTTMPGEVHKTAEACLLYTSECFPDVFALIERELRQCKFDSAAMKTVEALDGKL